MLKLDKDYRPLYLEVEAKDVAEGLNVLSNMKLSDGMKFDGVYLELSLNQGGPEHWAHFGGTVELELNSDYMPLRMTIEVKDPMGSEGVLWSAGLLTAR